MLSALGFSTLFEFVLVVFVLWAIFNENKFIKFEKRILSNLRRKRLKVVKPVKSHSEKVYQ